jgi:hypothetical protein
MSPRHGVGAPRARGLPDRDAAAAAEQEARVRWIKCIWRLVFPASAERITYEYVEEYQRKAREEQRQRREEMARIRGYLAEWRKGNIEGEWVDIGKGYKVWRSKQR